MHGLLSLSAVVLATGAFVLDLHRQKVPNIWILIGWAWGLSYQYGVRGWSGVLGFFAGAAVPVLGLFPLFLFRMLGPGDIKILSVLGGLLGCGDVVHLIIISFLMGGVLSLGLLVSCGMLASRIRHFADYLKTYLKDRKPRPYYRTGEQAENIHFTLPILLGVFLYVGGIY